MFCWCCDDAIAGAVAVVVAKEICFLCTAQTELKKPQATSVSRNLSYTGWKESEQIPCLPFPLLLCLRLRIFISLLFSLSFFSFATFFPAFISSLYIFYLKPGWLEHSISNVFSNSRLHQKFGYIFSSSKKMRFFLKDMNRLHFLPSKIARTGLRAFSVHTLKWK